jgi:hypothetical protein
LAGRSTTSNAKRKSRPLLCCRVTARLDQRCKRNTAHVLYVTDRLTLSLNYDFYAPRASRPLPRVHDRQARAGHRCPRCPCDYLRCRRPCQVSFREDARLDRRLHRRSGLGVVLVDPAAPRSSKPCRRSASALLLALLYGWSCVRSRNRRAMSRTGVRASGALSRRAIAPARR